MNRLLRLLTPSVLADAVLVAGVAVVSAGVALIYLPAGLIVFGAAAAAGAFLHERGRADR